MLLNEIADNEPLTVKLINQRLAKSENVFIYDEELMDGEERIIGIVPKGEFSYSIFSSGPGGIRELIYDNVWLEKADLMKRSANTWTLRISEKQIEEGYEVENGVHMYQAEDGDPISYVIVKRHLNKGGEADYITKDGKSKYLRSLHIEDGLVELHFLTHSKITTGELRSGVHTFDQSAFDDMFTVVKVSPTVLELRHAAE